MSCCIYLVNILRKLIIVVREAVYRFFARHASISQQGSLSTLWWVLIKHGESSDVKGWNHEKSSGVSMGENLWVVNRNTS